MAGWHVLVLSDEFRGGKQWCPEESVDHAVLPFYGKDRPAWQTKAATKQIFRDRASNDAAFAVHRL